jgi:hypothetical protein
VAALATKVAGTYTCKGVQLRSDGSSQPIQATIGVRLDLERAWIHASFAEAPPAGMKLEEFRTFDATAKQWTRVVMTSGSEYIVETSLGERDGRWTWEGTATSPNGTRQVRDHEQRDARQLKIWGEALLSGTWQKSYEVTCKR